MYLGTENDQKPRQIHFETNNIKDSPLQDFWEFIMQKYGIIEERDDVEIRTL